MALMRIADGKLFDIELADVPEQKRAQWREVIGSKPAIDPRVEVLSAPTDEVQGDRVLRTWQVTPRDLATVKSEFSATVDTDAEAQRLRFITAGQGMAMTYQEKKDQALAVLDLGSDVANGLANSGAAEYPLLAASVGTEVPTLYQAAELVMERYEAWSAIGGAIETQRLIAKKAISDASNVAQVKAAYEAIQWPA